jgi:hypothetical protein
MSSRSSTCTAEKPLREFDWSSLISFELLQLLLELLGDQGFDALGRRAGEERRDRGEALGQFGVFAARQQLERAQTGDDDERAASG